MIYISVLSLLAAIEYSSLNSNSMEDLYIARVSFGTEDKYQMQYEFIFWFL